MGCGICVYSCPGQAIKLIQRKGNRYLFKIPYELLPRPNKGETWHAVDRRGRNIGAALIENVMAAQDRTLLVTVGVEEGLLYEFAGIRRKHG